MKNKNNTMKNSRDIRQDRASIFPVSWNENDKIKEVEFNTEKMKYLLSLPAYNLTMEQIAIVWILKYFINPLVWIIVLITVICATFSWYPYVCLSRRSRAIIMTIVKNTEGRTDLLSLLLQSLNQSSTTRDAVGQNMAHRKIVVW